MGTQNEKPGRTHSDASDTTAVVAQKYADEALRTLEQYEHVNIPSDLSPERERQIRRKLYLHLMSLLIVLNLMMFVDKISMGYASILGLFQDIRMSKAQFNNLDTLFYIGYLIALLPCHYAIQKLPLGKVVSFIVFIWGATLLLQCAMTSYAGIAVLRFVLGMSESVAVPAAEMTMGMFFTRYERSFLQPLFFTSSMTAALLAAFTAYGLLWSTSAILPWKFFMIILGGLSILFSVVLWFFYPSNPSDAKFLTVEERVLVIRRVQESSQSAIEQKQFKPAQFRETLRDPISWLFALQAFTIMLSNSLTYFQMNLLITGLGISPLGSTLVTAAGSGFGFVCNITGMFALRWLPSNLAVHSLLWCLPPVVAGICMVTLDWERQIALLACLLIAAKSWATAYCISLGWTTSSAAGYTKKLTRNVMFMVGYCLGNLTSPQLWVPRSAPRYYGAWIAQIVVSWLGTPLILFIISYILSRRNRIRKTWAAQLTKEERMKHEYGRVEQVDEAGVVTHKKVPIALLDFTDLENPFFIYPI